MKTPSLDSFDLDITEGFAPIRFAAINNQLCFNLFEFEGSMVPTSGYSKIHDLGNVSQSRAIFYSDILKAVIVIIDDGIFQVTDTTKKRLGSLTTLSGRVYMAENALTNVPDSSTGLVGGQIAISDGQNVVVFTLDGEVNIAVNDSGGDLDFTPGVIAFQDDYFFINDASSNSIYASSLNDALVWPSNSKSSISSITTACTPFERMLLVFGKDLTSVFVDASDVPFPYKQDVSRAWEYGCSSPATLANASGLLAWLASNKYSKPIILHSTGGEPEKISNAGIDAIMDKFTNPNDSEGFIYVMQGHPFYQINFLTDNRSFLYDFITKKWFGVSEKQEAEVHHIRQTAFYEEGNEMLAISNQDGNIYKMSLNLFTQDDKVIPRTIITQNYTKDEIPFSVNQLNVQIEQGENENTSKVMLSISKDRGRTYRIKKLKELGNIGFRKELLRFHQLGVARWWTFKFDFYSRDRFAILSAKVFIK